MESSARLLESVDLFAHANPALCAAVLRWSCEGFQEERKKGPGSGAHGMSPMWGAMALALVCTPATAKALPKTSRKRLRNLFQEHPSWRIAVSHGLESWSEPFWRGVGFGVAARVLRYSDGALFAAGRLSVPVVEAHKTHRTRAKTLGKVIGKESDASVLAVALGLERLDVK